MPRRNKSIPQQRFAYSSACKTKRRYSSERKALEAVEDMKLAKPTLSLAVYRCDLCGGWHLTRRQA